MQNKFILFLTINDMVLNGDFADSSENRVFKTASHLKYNRLRAVGDFFDADIRVYIKEKNRRMCVICFISDILDCCQEK